MRSRDADAAVRISALDTLERHDAMPSLPAVLSALDDDNREVRLRAIRLHRPASAIRASRCRCSRASRTPTARSASRRSARSDLTRARRRRCCGLLADPTEDVRDAAIDALAALHAEAAVPPFVALARKRPADESARRAQVALGKVATPAAIAVLIALTRTPPVSAETRAALRGAGAAAVPPLVRELAGGTPGSVAIAAAALGDIGDRRATAPLCEALERHARSGAGRAGRARADRRSRCGPDAGACGRVGRSRDTAARASRRCWPSATRAAVVTLPRGLSDSDANVRELAARLAGAIGAQSSAPALAALLGDGERDVRRAAAVALAAVAAPSSSLLMNVVAGLARPGAPGRDSDEWEAIGETLERAAEPNDAGRLAAALKTAREPERTPLARALAAAQAGRAFTDGALALQLDRCARASRTAGDRGRRSPRGRTDSGGRAARVREAFCGRVPDGPCAALRRDRPDARRRGVAGGAGPRSRRDDRSARRRRLGGARARRWRRARRLGMAAHDDAAPVAANARAALRRRGGRRSRPESWVGARLRARDGTPIAGRWVTLSFASAGEVWAVTDDAGGVRLSGPASGPVQVRVSDALLRAE